LPERRAGYRHRREKVVAVAREDMVEKRKRWREKRWRGGRRR
jgi:hypothetical protein